MVEGYGQGHGELTLARKLDVVHRNTTTSSSPIPRVRRATPPRPSFSRKLLMLPRDAVVPEPEVLAVDGERERGGSESVVDSMPAVTECDLRRDEEEGCVWVVCWAVSSFCL